MGDKELKPKILAVTGISGSGKTPVCHYLSWNLKLHYEPEVAEYLIYQGFKPGAKASVLFDYYVAEMEMNRDLQLASHLPLWIVETWHVGNLAHMYARNSPLLDYYIKRVKPLISTFDAQCLHITGKIKDSLERSKQLNIMGTPKITYVPEDFLFSVSDGYEFAFKALNVKVKPIVAKRKTLKELEAESLRVAKEFFGDLKWDYIAGVI